MKKVLGVILFFVQECFWGTVNATGIIAAGALVASFFIYRYQLPEVKNLPEIKKPETSVIYDRTGQHVLYKIHGEENRKILSHDEIPDVIRVATIAAEDKSFYSHKGIDLEAIIRALKINIERHGIFQGGSTITQQLARNIFLSREKTITRKIKEAILAVKIENNLTKDQILDLYLNEVPYGSNAYGIESASEVYFKKDARELTLDEAVFLAALPKAPSYYSPYGSHRNELKKRQEDILAKLLETHAISPEQTEEVKNANTLAKVAPFHEPIVAPHFVFYIIEDLERRYGKEFLETGGLKIITTLDMDLEKLAERVVAEGAKRNKSRGAENAALAAVDPKTGEILAMAGSRDYFDSQIDGEVNVTLRPRQPGSSFKPIVYATAFEQGFQPETLIADAPANFGPDGSGEDYIPRNYDGKFHGVLPMRKTLAMSLNVPAIKTLKAVGIGKAINMADRLGITTLTEPKRYGLSLAIGGAEVRPLDLTLAFSVFANDGKRVTPHAIVELKDSEGKMYRPEIKNTQVINPQIARKINSILSDNKARAPIFGPKSPLFIPGREVAAKTGTTQEFRDAWTVGYTPEIAVGVWAGNNDSRPMTSGSDGVFVAAPIWRQFMDGALPRYPADSFITYEQTSTGPHFLSQEEKEAEQGITKAEKELAKKKKKGQGA